jgi:isopenicillin N synthase-like dioxygenase
VSAVPVIDLSRLDEAEAARAIDAACRETGFY